MPYTIVKRGDKHCVVKKDGGKTFGCHGSHAEAVKQMRAIYAHTRDMMRAGGGPGSGDFGHAGRPGHEGGSAKRKTGKDLMDEYLDSLPKGPVPAGTPWLDEHGNQIGETTDINGSTGVKFFDKPKKRKLRGAMQARLTVGSAGLHRYEKMNDKEYLVVPVVALMEGVVTALGADGPEYVRPSAYSVAPGTWNGRPIFLNHPVDAKGRPVSGSDPKIYANALGYTFNAHLDEDGRLCMEAWIDEDRAKTKQQRALIDRLKLDDDVEVSVGAFIVMEEEDGEYDGKKYSGAWAQAFPDHLALLEKGISGACSRKMGCGVRAAMEASLEAFGGPGSGDFGHAGRPGHAGGSAPKSGKAFKGSNVLTPDGQVGRVIGHPVLVSDTRDLGQYIRVKTPDGVVHSLYQDAQGHVHERNKDMMKKISQMLDEGMIGTSLRDNGGKGSGDFGHAGRPGHQGGSARKFVKPIKKRNEPNYDLIAPPMNEDFTAAPDEREIGYGRRPRKAKKRNAKEDSTMAGRVSALIDGALQYLGLQSPEDTGDMELRDKIQKELCSAFPGMPTYNTSITMVYPAKNQVVYSIYDKSEYRYFQVDYTQDAAGDIEIDTESVIEVERVTRFEPIEPDEEEITAMRAACGDTPCAACKERKAREQTLTPSPWDGPPEVMPASWD